MNLIKYLKSFKQSGPDGVSLYLSRGKWIADGFRESGLHNETIPQKEIKNKLCPITSFKEKIYK